MKKGFTWSASQRGLRLGMAALLLVSLACNVAALCLPFFRLREGLGEEAYTLLSSVRMLWESKLYFLAALVVSFSVCFPFAKLGTMAVALGTRRPGSIQQKALGLVKHVGKWSLLDAYLVCLVLGLTTDQLLVGAAPMPGITLFVAAILLSMVAGESLSHVMGEAPTEPPPERNWKGPWGAVLLLISAALLLGALFIPFLQIQDWLLVDRHYSLLTLVGSLLAEGFLTSGVLAGSFLIVTPLVTLAGSAWYWVQVQRNQPGPARKWPWRLTLLRRWSMLDVFCLALAVFLLEGKTMMATQVRMGAGFLVLVVVLQRATQWAAEHPWLRKRG